jgi:hypothetical protein
VSPLGPDPLTLGGSFSGGADEALGAVEEQGAPFGEQAHHPSAQGDSQGFGGKPVVSERGHGADSPPSSPAVKSTWVTVKNERASLYWYEPESDGGVSESHLPGVRG